MQPSWHGMHHLYPRPSGGQRLHPFRSCDEGGIGNQAPGLTPGGSDFRIEGIPRRVGTHIGIYRISTRTWWTPALCFRLNQHHEIFGPSWQTGCRVAGIQAWCAGTARDLRRNTNLARQAVGSFKPSHGRFIAIL